MQRCKHSTENCHQWQRDTRLQFTIGDHYWHAFWMKYPAQEHAHHPRRLLSKNQTGFRLYPRTSSFYSIAMTGFNCSKQSWRCPVSCLMQLGHAASDGQLLFRLEDNGKYIYNELRGNNEQEHCKDQRKQLQSLKSVLFLPPSLGQTRWIKEALWIRKTPMCAWIGMQDPTNSATHGTKQSRRDQDVRRTSKCCY